MYIKSPHTHSGGFLYYCTMYNNNKFFFFFDSHVCQLYTKWHLRDHGIEGVERAEKEGRV
jgi:hypothetical protein